MKPSKIPKDIQEQLKCLEVFSEALKKASITLLKELEAESEK